MLVRVHFWTQLCWSECPSLRQDHTLLSTVALYEVLKSGHVSCPVLIFLKMVLAGAGSCAPEQDPVGPCRQPPP